MNNYDIEESPANKAARERVLGYIKVGSKEEERLIDFCAANIPRDRYVPMHMHAIRYSALYREGRGIRVVYRRGDEEEPIKIHRHALGQLCDLYGMPRAYASKLNEDSEKGWKRTLLAHNFNDLLENQEFINRKKQSAKFLHRLVGDELRAVLTQSYNRHLVSAKVLQPFLAAMRQANLHAAKATVTDMRVHLQTYLPYAFEPIPGEFVALGTAWSNSDFGQGKLKISHTVLRLKGMGNLVTDDTFSRMHLTSVVEDTDMVLSDEVATKELEAVAAATIDAVFTMTKPEQVKKILDAIKAADEEKVPWAKLKEHLGKFLSKKNLSSVEAMLADGIEDLPPIEQLNKDGSPVVTRWWAASVLAHLSEKQVDPTEAMEFKQAAGKFLATDDKASKGSS